VDDLGKDDAEVVAKGGGSPLLAGGGLSDPVAIGEGGCEHVSRKGCGAVMRSRASLGSSLLCSDPSH
jgi:hypothetical protein